MNQYHLDDLRRLLKSSMSEWDVAVEVNRSTADLDYYADVKFTIWGIEIDDELELRKGIWQTVSDCPLRVNSPREVWVYIASKFHDKIIQKMN
jgi:hypothetical protein